MRICPTLAALALLAVSAASQCQSVAYRSTLLPVGPIALPNLGEVEFLPEPLVTVSAAPPGTDISLATVRVVEDPITATQVNVPFTVNLTINGAYTKAMGAVLEGYLAPGQAQLRVRWLSGMPAVLGSEGAQVSVWPIPSSPPGPMTSMTYGILSAHIVSGGSAFPSLTGLSLSPASVGVGGYSLATLTASAPAPLDGLAVKIASSDEALVGVPGSIVIPAGISTITFPVAGRGVTSPSAVVTATALGSTAASDLSVVTTQPAGLKGDMDGDGRLNLIDVIRLLRIVAGVDAS